MKRYILTLILMAVCVAIIAQESEHQSDRKESSRSNINIEMVQMFVNNAFDSISVCNNEESIRLFKERIDSIKCYLKDNKKMHLDKMIFFVLNFELLTKIESESDGDFLGKYKPTYNDLEKWQAWLQENSRNICWYKGKNILYLRK